MKTVNEVSKLTGVSVRTLHHYDAIGLLKPTAVSEAGYRLYDDTSLERLQQILFFRELEFPLKDIGAILNSPDFDRSKALEQHIALLTLKKEHLERLIELACEIKTRGVNKMDLTAFDTSKIERYAAEAKAAYGSTREFKEFEEKSKKRTKEENKKLNIEMTAIFSEFGEMRELPPDAEKVQKQVKKLRDFLTENYYNCSKETLRGLGRLYIEDERFTANIDKAGGNGTAKFVYEAIEKYFAE